MSIKGYLMVLADCINKKCDMDQTDGLKGDIDVTKFQDFTCDTVTLVTVSMLRSYFKRPFTLTQLIKSNYKQFQLKLLKKSGKNPIFLTIFQKFQKNSRTS